MSVTVQLSRKLEVAARKVWLKQLSDANDVDRILSLYELPSYFTRLCALASLGDMPGVAGLYDRMSSRLCEIALVPALAELSREASLSPCEQHTLARLNAFLGRMKCRPR